MLQKASEKQIYDELVCCDALEFLADSEKGYDLVIAADFLVYVGDLEPLFSAIRNRINV